MRSILPRWTYVVRESPISSNFQESNVTRFRSLYGKLAAYSTIELPNNDITSSCSDHNYLNKKILYNDIYHLEKKNERKRILNERIIRRDGFYSSTGFSMVKPLFLECMTNSNGKNEMENSGIEPVIHFPYESNKCVLVDGVDSDISEESLEVESSDNMEESFQFDTQLKRVKKGEFEFRNVKQWQGEEERVIMIDDTKFGSSDSNVPVSNVPCGGCGALLHCKDMAIPGFLPKEIFIDLTETDLRAIICQRCLYLQEYNLALGINVSSDEYPKILSQIKMKKALVILMVDLLDFPCSIWPNIMDVIGKDKPLFIVGNKYDLIIQENKHKFINNYRIKCLMNALESSGINPAKIKHVSFISAKTGYGVENLITNLQNLWGTKGDIYITGCTNAGKSTLFNSLIQSDFCKVQASEILQRATVSQWPGTTLNLLKFPILKPLSWRKVIRTQRLKFTENQMAALRKLQTSALHNKGKDQQIKLMGYIGRSFGKQESSGVIGLDPNDPEFRLSKWCYDTPGVVHKSQILNLFTTEELSKVLPETTIVPRNFKLIAGNSLFIAGIARLDLVTSNTFVWFTVFASADLPVTVTNVEDADIIYQKLLGTNLFGVPSGNKERLEKWPKLSSKDVTVVGIFKDVAAADIVLSSSGWVAITLEPARSCTLRAWTPDGRGIFVREPSFIKYSSMYRSKKIKGTPAYYPSIKIIDNVEVVV